MDDLGSVIKSIEYQVNQRMINELKERYGYHIELLKKHCDFMVSYVESGFLEHKDPKLMVMLESKDAHWLDWEKKLIRGLFAIPHPASEAQKTEATEDLISEAQKIDRACDLEKGGCSENDKVQKDGDIKV